MGRQRPPSRPRRWANACANARSAMDDIQNAASNLQDALTELQEIQSEYQDWADNLPENLQGSALYDKLSAITDLDFDQDVESALSDLTSVIDEAEGADLPLGFGRD